MENFSCDNSSRRQSRSISSPAHLSHFPLSFHPCLWIMSPSFPCVLLQHCQRATVVFLLWRHLVLLQAHDLLFMQQHPILMSISRGHLPLLSATVRCPLLSSDASPAAECLLCCRRCFEVGCGFARDVPFVAKPFFFYPSINTLSPLLWKCCFRELWSMYWLQQSQHLLVLKFQAASLKG